MPIRLDPFQLIRAYRADADWRGRHNGPPLADMSPSIPAEPTEGIVPPRLPRQGGSWLVDVGLDDRVEWVSGGSFPFSGNPSSPSGSPTYLVGNQLQNRIPVDITPQGKVEMRPTLQDPSDGRVFMRFEWSEGGEVVESIEIDSSVSDRSDIGFCHTLGLSSDGRYALFAIFSVPGRLAPAARMFGYWLVDNQDRSAQYVNTPFVSSGNQHATLDGELNAASCVQARSDSVDDSAYLDASRRIAITAILLESGEVQLIEREIEAVGSIHVTGSGSTSQTSSDPDRYSGSASVTGSGNIQITFKILRDGVVIQDHTESGSLDYEYNSSWSGGRRLTFGGCAWDSTSVSGSVGGSVSSNPYYGTGEVSGSVPVTTDHLNPRWSFGLFFSTQQTILSVKYGLFPSSRVRVGMHEGGVASPDNVVNASRMVSIQEGDAGDDWPDWIRRDQSMHRLYDGKSNTFIGPVLSDALAKWSISVHPDYPVDSVYSDRASLWGDYDPNLETDWGRIPVASHASRLAGDSPGAEHNPLAYVGWVLREELGASWPPTD